MHHRREERRITIVDGHQRVVGQVQAELSEMATVIPVGHGQGDEEMVLHLGELRPLTFARDVLEQQRIEMHRFAEPFQHGQVRPAEYTHPARRKRVGSAERVETTDIRPARGSEVDNADVGQLHLAGQRRVVGTRRGARRVISAFQKAHADASTLHERP